MVYAAMPLTLLEKKIIASIQGDLPIIEEPFAGIAKDLDITEDLFFEILQNLCDKGVVRRFGATLRHQKSGFKANAMTAWEVDESKVEAAGAIMASFKEVSHCYRRNPTKQWPYNLYTMIHGFDQSAVIKTAKFISEKTKIKNYSLLFSQTELKKTSMNYFS